LRNKLQNISLLPPRGEEGLELEVCRCLGVCVRVGAYNTEYSIDVVLHYKSKDVSMYDHLLCFMHVHLLCCIISDTIVAHDVCIIITQISQEGAQGRHHSKRVLLVAASRQDRDEWWRAIRS
jgi:hypothetical protein